jgi:hypothetical protein
MIFIVGMLIGIFGMMLQVVMVYSVVRTLIRFFMGHLLLKIYPKDQYKITKKWLDD